MIRAEAAPPELRDRFELGSPLGTGTRGVVWPARDPQTGRQCAVKALHRASPADSALLKGEYRTLVRCRHPHIVSTERLVVRPSTCWFEMELVEGPSITRWARRLEGPWTPARDRSFRAVVGQLVSAVQAIHALGLVHRDVKPGNILVGPDDRLVLLDFDLAGPPIADPSRGRILGTPGYRPPEQALGLPVGPAADWFAVGAVLYEMLLGQPPFGRRPRAALRAQRRRRPPDLTAARPDLPADISVLVRDLLQAEPAARPTPEALARAFPGPALPAVAPVSRGTLDRCRAALRAPGPTWTDLRAGTAAVRRHLWRVAGPPDILTLVVRVDPREDVPDALADAIAGSLVQRLRGMARDDRTAVLPRDRISLLDAFPDFALLPELAPFTPREPARRPEPLARLLAAVGARHPTRLVIEDAHRLTPPDVALLDHLLGSAPAVSVVTEGEPHTAAPRLRALHARASSHRRLRVGAG